MTEPSLPRRRASAAALIACCALLLAGGAARAGMFDPTTFSLDNGLEVVVVEDHRAPVAVQMLWYKVGAADEPKGKSGIAHFLEHLMFKGTGTVGPGEFSRIVARNGGRDNAFTSHDYTGYVQNVAADKLELVMRLEADRMTNLVLTDAVVAPEREVVLEERRSRTDNEPGAQLGEQLAASQFLAHPYGTPVIGWAHEIAALTTADALDFYRAYYAPNNAILVVAGDVDPAEVRRLAEQYYGPIPARAVPPRLRPQEPPQLAARRVILRDGQVSQPEWQRSYLAPTQVAGKTEYALPLRVFAEVLGGGPTSRLYRTLVVERKIASNVYAHYSSLSIDQDRFWIGATPAPGRDVDALERAIEGELAKLLEDGVAEDDVARAKTGMIASAVYARDSIQTAARVLGTALNAGLSAADVEAWPQRTEQITVQEVDRAARAVLRSERSVTGILLPRPAN